MAELHQAGFNVFPGLRPFEPDEAYLFFGRDGQSDELIRRLAKNRFLAVVGTSGSGKSSLVRAGLLAFLRSGYLSEAGSSWRIALLRPGLNPIASLAAALNHDSVLGNGDLDPATRLNHIETTLRRSSFGLVEAVRQAQIGPHQNLLVVVDQFEEIFRMRRVRTGIGGPDDEAAAFVKLLLEACHQTELSIYVVITMRSDFIGDCSEFRDLPESLNQSQYLIPRMTRDQCQEAIEGPIAVGGATITARLVQRLLNDVGDDPDHLPVLQHALMRTWETWSSHVPTWEPVDLVQYEQIGGMATALSRHADEAFQELDERGRLIARKMFQRLSEIGKDNRETRRPTKLSEICAVVEADEAEVIAVINKFRTAGRTFLAPAGAQALHADSVVEISHESLIRLWDRLRKWAEDEAESATLYRRLVDAAARHAAGGAALWRDPELQLAIDWKERSRPNEAWAERYGGEFTTAMRFLELSRVESAYRERLRRAGFAGSIMLSIVFAVICVFAVHEMLEARRLTVLSFARQLASQSQLVADQDPGQTKLASLLAVEAVRRAPLVETTASLFKFLRSLPIVSAAFPKPEANGAHVASAVSADGHYAAHAAGDSVTVFDVRQGKQILRLGSDGVRSVVLSPEGKFLGVASDYNVGVVEVASGKKIWRHDAVSPTAIALSPGANYAAISYESRVEVYRIYGNTELFVLPRREDAEVTGARQARSQEARPLEAPRFGRNGYHAIGFSIDNHLFAAAGENVDNAVYDLQTGSRAYPLSGARHVTALVFAPGNDLVVTAGEDVSEFDQASGQVRDRFRSEGSVAALAISPNGRYIAAAANQSVALFDTSAGKATGSLLTTEPATALAFGAKGQSLLAATASRLLTFEPIEDREISLANAADLGLVAISPGAKFIAMVFGLGKRVVCRTMERSSGKITSNQELTSGQPGSIAVSGEGRYVVATPKFPGLVPIINMDTGAQQPDSLASGAYSAVAFSADGLLLAAASDAVAQPGSEILIGKRMESSIVRPLLPQFRVQLLSFSPDGKFLAAAGDKSIVVYNTTSDRERGRFDVADDLRAITLSFGAKYLATAASSRIAIYDVASGEEVMTYPTQSQQSASAMGLSGDGSQVVLATPASYGLAIGQYPSDPDALCEEVCMRLGRNLTGDEWNRYMGSERYRKTCPDLP